MYKKFKEWVSLKEDMSAVTNNFNSSQPAPPKVQQNTRNDLNMLKTTAAAGNPQQKNTLALAQQRFAPIAKDPKQAIDLAKSVQSLQQQMKK